MNIFRASKDKEKDKEPSPRSKTISQRSSSGSGRAKAQFAVPLKDFSDIPVVLSTCIAFFDIKGVDSEGIFRQSGNQGEIQQLRQKFDSGQSVNLSSCDPHTVSGLLKLWVRELPEPLLTYDNYDCFLAAASVQVSDASIKSAQAALKLLPSIHYKTTKFLCSFLFRVSMSSEINKMTPQNLAVVFAPNLLRPKEQGSDLKSITTTLIQDTPYSLQLMTMFVENYPLVFEDAKVLSQLSAPTREQLIQWRSSRAPGALAKLK